MFKKAEVPFIKINDAFNFIAVLTIFKVSSVPPKNQ